MDKNPKLEHADFYKTHFKKKSVKSIKNQFIDRYNSLLTKQS